MHPKAARFRRIRAVAAIFMVFALTGCDLELDLRAHADVPFGDSHTLHIRYRRGPATP